MCVYYSLCSPSLTQKMKGSWFGSTIHISISRCLTTLIIFIHGLKTDNYSKIKWWLLFHAESEVSVDSSENVRPLILEIEHIVQVFIFFPLYIIVLIVFSKSHKLTCVLLFLFLRVVSLKKYSRRKFAQVWVAMTFSSKLWIAVCPRTSNKVTKVLLG